MKIDLNHPAIRLGAWLRSARQARGYVKRIEKKNEKAIVATLELVDLVLSEFNELLAAARKALALKFSDIFSRDELSPVRYRLSPDRAISEIERELILNAVFATPA